MIKFDFSLEELAQIIGGQVINDSGHRVSCVASIKALGSDGVCFLYDDSAVDFVKKSSSAIVIKPEFASMVQYGIAHPNPLGAYHCFLKSLNTEKEDCFIHPTARVHERAIIGDNVRIDEYVVIGDNCVIGDNVKINAGTVIEKSVVIGCDTIIRSNVTLCHGVQIGEFNVLHANCVVGADGFGYHFDKSQGHWVSVPQIGAVVTGNRVEIGANTTIDRGAIENTIIEKGVIIDNQVQIGHNVVIGEYTAIAGSAGVAGSTKIGKHCQIGGAAVINGHIQITDNVVINGHSSVYKSITKSGVYSSVLPAMPVNEWLRLVGYLRRIKILFKA